MQIPTRFSIAVHICLRLEFFDAEGNDIDLNFGGLIATKCIAKK